MISQSDLGPRMDFVLSVAGDNVIHAIRKMTHPIKTIKAAIQNMRFQGRWRIWLLWGGLKKRGSSAMGVAGSVFIDGSTC